MNLSRVIAVGWCSLIAALVACKGDSRNAFADSSAAKTGPPAVVPVAADSSGWDEAAGPVLILSAANDAASVTVVLPQLADNTLANAGQSDFSKLSNSRLELFSPSGLAGEATLLAVSAPAVTEPCDNWPVGRIAGQPRKPWRVGFVKGRVTGVPLDSIQGMSGSDSAAFTAQVMQIMSAYSQRGDSAFHGLPFSIRKAYRFSMGSTKGFVSSVVRKINEEANPRQEHFFIVAERSGGTYREVFQRRSAGPEESVQTSEILALVNLVETGQPAIVVGFAYEEGARTGLIERTSEGRWRAAWRSAYAGC